MDSMQSMIGIFLSYYTFKHKPNVVPKDIQCFRSLPG